MAQVSSSLGSCPGLSSSWEDAEPLLGSAHTPRHSKRRSLLPSSLDTGRSPRLRRNSFNGSSTEEVQTKTMTPKLLVHPAFQSIQQQQCSSLDPEGRLFSTLQTVLTCSPMVSPAALSQTLEFLYTGALPSRAALHLADLDKVQRHALTSFNNQVGSLLEVPHLLDYVANMRSKEDFLNSEVTEQMVATISHQLEDIILGRRLFSDIEVTSSITHLHCLPQFALDDGKVAAHKPILMARCDMMQVNHSDLDFCCWLHLADYCFLQRVFFYKLLAIYIPGHVL